MKTVTAEQRKPGRRARVRSTNRADTIIVAISISLTPKLSRRRFHLAITPLQ